MIRAENEFSAFKKAHQRSENTDVFSPQTFDEYVGQDDVKKLLKLSIQAAKQENRPLPNILISGGFGLGKTSLAKIVVSAYGIKPILLDGASVNKSLPPLNSTVIIDEIHALNTETCDTLNLLIDMDKIHIIGCTTDTGALPGAFRSRFRHLHLKNYSVGEISVIAKNVCAKKRVTINPNILRLISERSRSNARQVITYLSIMFDILAIKNSQNLTKEVTIEAFKMLGVDEKGYLERDRLYVRSIPNRPVGLSWLSSVLGIDKTTIEEEIEPFLMQTGVIDRTPKGRVKIKEI